MKSLRKFLEETKNKTREVLNGKVLIQSVEKETEKALLVELFNVKELESFTMWIPKSVIETIDKKELTLTDWFFEKNIMSFAKTIEL